MTSNKYYKEKNCSKQHENENYCPTYLFIFSKKRIYKTKNNKNRGKTTQIMFHDLK